jgi:hypothetical protein
MDRLKREVLDNLFLAAVQDPGSGRATLKIEKIRGEPLCDELETLVTGSCDDAASHLIQAIQDQP